MRHKERYFVKLMWLEKLKIQKNDIWVIFSKKQSREKFKESNLMRVRKF